MIAYAVFLFAFLYAIGFVGNLAVPKSIDSGAAGSLLEAVIVNTALLGLFAVQHSVMARPAFKRWWTRFVPKSIERSTYVLLASLTLLVLYWGWRPIPEPVWTVSNPAGAAGLQMLFLMGWTIVLLSTFMIDHFELFGLKQTFMRTLDKEPTAPVFKTPFFYRWVRHPIYLGFLLAFWATPTMTVGHLLFAMGTTAYILIGIFLEERDLVRAFGERYRVYRKQVGMLLPLPSRKIVDRPLGRAPFSEEKPST